MKLKTIITATIILIAYPYYLHANATSTEDDVVEEKSGGEYAEFPEAMSFELDSLINLYMSRNYLDEDSECNMTDVNPEYDEETYIDRLTRLPTLIEMPYNDVVRKFIDRYSGKLRHSVSYMLGASNFFMPLFEEALESYGLPLELKYLPIVESALNPTAVSSAGAAGLWQFTVATGKRYGLEINSLVDDRLDPVKSSYAAAHYLSELYSMFGDWTLALAAYNCGPDQLNKAIHRAKGERDYWQIYPYLPRETRGYVPAFIAANYIMTYYCDHNICPMTTRLPAHTDTVMVNQELHLIQIADVCNIDIDLLRALNPSYRSDIIPGNISPCPVRLAQTDVARFIDYEDSVYAYRPESLVSKRSVVTVKSDEPAKTSKKKKKSSGAQYITIKSGQTLGSIAKKYGTTVRKLQQLNGLRNTKIRAGKRLRVR